ncbi:MAG: GAF domain-containing protein [Chloroflexi bacterium]|nr:GAF domain-containing protein [Chloroflexota bacterium]
MAIGSADVDGGGERLFRLCARAPLVVWSEAVECALYIKDERGGATSAQLVCLRRPKGPETTKASSALIERSIRANRVIGIDRGSAKAWFPQKAKSVLHSGLIVPILHGRRPVGAMVLSFSAPKRLHRDDLCWLKALAAQVGAAIERMRARQELDEKRALLRVLEKERLELGRQAAIGRWAAGVAHGLKNSLTIVVGYAQLLQMMPGLDEDARSTLLKIHSQAQQAAQEWRRLLTLARRGDDRAQMVDVNQVVDRALDMLAYQLDDQDVSVYKDLAPSPLPVWADPDRLQEAFINLIDNALDAMKASPYPRLLRITSRLCRDQVSLTFGDSGPGLSAEALEHLFEPFFTTKEAGKGTGLGLTICHDIVQRYGGQISAQSAPGTGATFILHFPLADPACVGGSADPSPADCVDDSPAPDAGALLTPHQHHASLGL